MDQSSAIDKVSNVPTPFLNNVLESALDNVPYEV